MEIEQAVDILRRARHDFSNYLQVISGYIELDRAEEAKGYILALVNDLAAERIIFDNQEAEATLYFYQQLLMARELGIILRYKELGDSWAVCKSCNEPFASLTKLAPQFKGLEDDPPVTLSLTGVAGEVKMMLEWQDPASGQLQVVIEELK